MLPRRISEDDLKAILDAIHSHDGATAQEILRSLATSIPLRTLQYRLRHLVATGRLVQEGKGPSAQYRATKVVQGVGVAVGAVTVEAYGEATIPLSDEGADIQKHVRQPLQTRKPVGYNREFLDKYRPNLSAYLSPTERKHLREVGTPKFAAEPAGTYAKQILNRLLIDLSWNSSRLEGNTYSLLDTRRLIEFGQEAEGRERLEAQMILNHKDAIEFLVGAAEEIGFNRYTILNLHALLANNLLADPMAAGKLRNIPVSIEKSTYHPLEIPQLIEESFDQILATTAAIEDPFEQALFFMVQSAYLQPFDDVNKRVTRLAANIPLIKANLSPLTFTDVPRATYTDAILGVYELNKTVLLRDVFVWAYERSAARYSAVRQSLGDPDPFRLRRRQEIGEVVSQVIKNRMNKKAALEYLSSWTQSHIDSSEHEQFKDTVESELLGLHRGNFARYRVTPAQFEEWEQAWSKAIK